MKDIFDALNQEDIEKLQIQGFDKVQAGKEVKDSFLKGLPGK